MKKIKFLLPLLAVFFGSLNLNALDFSRGLWYALTQPRVFLQLVEYGAYDFDTGRRLNKFQPSSQNGNMFENASLLSDNEGTRFVWGCTADGNWVYRVRIDIDDDTMYFTGRRKTSEKTWQKYSGWIKIVAWESSRMTTVSNDGIYRVWEVLQR